MRPTSLLREALASAWAAKVPSMLVAVVTAAMCFVALMTVGQSAANQAAVQASLEGAGARALIVRDSTGDQGFINTRTLTAVESLSSVQSALALSLPFDAFNGRIGRGGQLVTTWPVKGDLSKGIVLTRGRWPQPGEALISGAAQTKLGLVAPVGYLVAGTAQYPIVGQFTGPAPFDDLATGAIINANNVDTATELRVVIKSTDLAPATQSAVLGILAPADAANTSVQSPLGAAELAGSVSAQLARYGRSLLLLILAAGGLFIAAVVLSDVLVRRRDLGRRRTLGSTRIDLALLVTLRATIPAGIGSFLGAAVARSTSQSQFGPPAEFSIAVALLATLTAAVAALAPAWYAATRDPVRVMRTA